MVIPRGKDFLVRISFYWKPLLQGRLLILTNTLSGGVTLSLGDIIQQTREKMKDPQKIRDWSRTGENIQLCTVAVKYIGTIHYL